MTTETENNTDNSDFYQAEDTKMETFDDIGDDIYEDVSQQTIGTKFDDDEDEEEAAPKKSEKKKEDKKDSSLEALDLVSDEDKKDQTKTKGKKEEEDEEEDEDKEDDKEESKDELKSKTPKGKPTYVTVDGETYALSSDALIATQVDGKQEKISLQELKNNYAGKVAWDKKFNEINLKEQTIKKTAEQTEATIGRWKALKEQIAEIATDEEKNPEEILNLVFDELGYDSYDLKEKLFKSQLSELANVLNMEPAERKAYFLEKKNGHLLQQSQKRQEKDKEEQERNSYKTQADSLRKSSGVSEAQYVEALEELNSFGYKDEDLTVNEIVEWAATKPHRDTVKTLLTPYEDQFNQDAYGELSWKLAQILRSGQETPEIIKKHLAEVYGVPSEVKELSMKLNPLGKKKSAASNKSTIPPKKYEYESFDDLEED